MKSFFKGFFSIFSWMDCYNDLSPKERVDEIFDDFYADYPWIERDDNKALENDWKIIGMVRIKEKDIK
jgi:hypothetical protein